MLLYIEIKNYDKCLMEKNIFCLIPTQSSILTMS